ncbi:MAG: hypothetical protein IKB70_06175 [Bacilli bacterium]|nr:hypothetical protein [Bacilli bacterium]
MKKLGIKLLSLVMTCVLLFSFGCGGKKVDNAVEDTKNLHIVAIERGYGTKMIDEWIKGFKAVNPGVNVTLKKVVESGQIQTLFQLGPSHSDYDIFFDISSIAASYDYGDRNLFPGYEGHALMSYTDIYNSKVYNENVTLAQKMNPSALELMKGMEGDDNYYAFPFAVALQSIVLNTKVVEEALGSSYKLPNTTDELFAFANSIKDAGYTAFAYPGQLDYWKSMFITWWAQYEGVDNYEMFFKGKVYDETQEMYIYSQDIFKQQGRLESLKVMEELLVLENGLHLANVNDYNANNFTTLQTAFLHSDAATSNQRKYAMFPNGDWLATESAKGRQVDPIIMMQAPVVSSIKKKCTTIADDAELSKLIDAIDAGSTALVGNGYDVNQADYNTVAEARNIVYSQMNNHIVFSPVYSNAKTLIKKFLLYIASDEGIQTYYDNVDPGVLPLNYEYPTTNDAFTNSVVKLYNKRHIAKGYGTMLYCNGVVTATTINSGYYEALMGISKTSALYRSAQQLYEMEFVTEDAFTLSLRNLGLIN